MLGVQTILELIYDIVVRAHAGYGVHRTTTARREPRVYEQGFTELREQLYSMFKVVQYVLLTAWIAYSTCNLIIAHIRMLHLHEQDLYSTRGCLGELEYLQNDTGQRDQHICLACFTYLLQQTLRYPWRYLQSLLVRLSCYRVLQLVHIYV